MYGTVVNRMRMVSMGEGGRRKKKKNKEQSVWAWGSYLVFEPIEINFHRSIMINQ